MAKVTSRREEHPTVKQALADYNNTNAKNPKTLTSSIPDKLDKTRAVENHVSRFNL